MVTTDDVLPAVSSIAAQVWESLFDSAATIVDAIPDSELGPDMLTYSIGVYGAWEGTVSLTCSAVVGEQMTRSMLALPASDDVDPLDLQDALGEVVNVIGGNVKSLVDGCTLGLPQVGNAAPRDDAPIAVLYIEWGNTAVRVSVHNGHNVTPEGDDHNAGPKVIS
jgi:chemotaxis protein CheX